MKIIQIHLHMAQQMIICNKLFEILIITMFKNIT